MRKFMLRPFAGYDGYEVDLDDEDTYKHLPQTLKELKNLFYKEVGLSYVYMNFIHRDIFNNPKFGNQKQTVDNFIQHFVDGEKENFNNLMWYKEQVYIFQDLIENQC